MPPGRSTKAIALSGLALSLVGGVIDLLSGYSMTQGANVVPMMSESSQALFGIGLFGVGVLVMFTGLLLVTERFSGRMSLLGALMEVYGIVMGLVSTYAPGMNPSAADGMLVVGILMFLNGILMQSRRKTADM
jgi:hypothetical protein